MSYGPTPQERRLFELSGVPVDQQRAMGEMEWTRWLDQLVARFPERFDATGSLIL